MQDKLKQCPLCGGQAEFVSFVDWSERQMQGIPACTVQCKECGVKIPTVVSEDTSFAYKDLAQERWNRRVEDGKQN